MNPRALLLVQSLAVLVLLETLGSFVMRSTDLSYAPIGLAVYLLYVIAGGGGPAL